MVKKGNRRKLIWVERCLVFYRTRIFYTIVPEERPFPSLNLLTITHTVIHFPILF